MLHLRFVSSGPGSNADAISKMYQLMKEIFKNLEDGLGFDITKEEFDYRYFQVKSPNNFLLHDYVTPLNVSENNCFSHNGDGGAINDVFIYLFIYIVVLQCPIVL